jgi:hypothetical protein
MVNPFDALRRQRDPHGLMPDTDNFVNIKGSAGR